MENRREKLFIIDMLRGGDDEDKSKKVNKAGRLLNIYAYMVHNGV